MSCQVSRRKCVHKQMTLNDLMKQGRGSAFGNATYQVQKATVHRNITITVLEITNTQSFEEGKMLFLSNYGNDL